MEKSPEKKEENASKNSCAVPERRSLPYRLSRIFLSTLYLSAFTFGGGYVIVTLLKNKFVDQLHWIDEEEMLDLVAIAQSSPGAIAVNGAIVVGYKLCGIPGILFAVLGAVLPPFCILTLISFFYDFFRENFVAQSLLSGMKSGVSAVILSVVYDMGSELVRERDPVKLLLLVGSFIANYFFRVNVSCIILIAALSGLIRTLLREKILKKTAKAPSSSDPEGCGAASCHNKKQETEGEKRRKEER